MMRSLTIPSQAVPKGRPRFTRDGHVYTPVRTLAWEEEVGWLWKAKYPGMYPFTGPVALVLLFRGELPGDLDNYQKAAEDGLNGLAWNDDRQVKLCVSSMRAGTDCVLIKVVELKDEVRDSVLAAAFGGEYDSPMQEVWD